MRGSKALWATVSVLALTAGASLLPSQAVAQINIPGMVFGAIHGGIPNNNGSYGNSRRGRVHESSKHDRHSKDAKEEDEPSEHSSASNSKSGPEQLSAPVRSDPQPPPPSQPQPQTAASGPAPKSSGEEPSFSPSR
jgi:hypothetical protein